MSDEQAIIPMEEYKRLKNHEVESNHALQLKIDDWLRENPDKVPVRTVYDRAKAYGDVRLGSVMALVCMALAFLGVYQWDWGLWSIIPGFFSFVGLFGVWMETE